MGAKVPIYFLSNYELVASAFICLTGCSVGATGLPLLLIDFNWLLVLMLSFISGFISSVVFISAWNFGFP